MKLPVIIFSMCLISCGPANLSQTKSFCLENPHLEKIKSFDSNESFSFDAIQKLSKSVAVVEYDHYELCTATAIGEDIIVTASHCLEFGNDGLSDYKVKFHYIEDEDGYVDEDQILSYSFKEILSQGSFVKIDSPDALVVRLDRKLDPSIPRKSFSKNPVVVNQPIAILQHPDGRSLEVGVGSVKKIEDGVIHYGNISTQGGSSGASIFNEYGEIVGIHVRGGCSLSSLDGANKGVSLSLLGEDLPWFKNILQKIGFGKLFGSKSKTYQ